MEPLSVALHATELSNAKIGETAIVLGSGCIGLCTVMALKARGVSEIYVTDVVDKRLEKALEVGGNPRYLTVRGKTLWSCKNSARRRCGSGLRMCGKPCDNSADMQTDQTCRKSHIGWCVTEPVLELDIATLNAMEGTVYSVYRYRNMYPIAIAAVSSGVIPLKKIVSHVFDLRIA